MAPSFNPTDTPILWYGPKAHTNPGRRNDRCYLLWPAWAHRVMAPQIQPRKLNLLATAILRIYRASRLTAVEIGKHLGIEQELAAYVIVELQGAGYLSDDYQVTQSGVGLLENEAEARIKLTPGWVFRDPWSKKLWPFVAREWLDAETTISDSGYPQLLLGTKGKPWAQRTFTQHPDKIQPRPPEPYEILRAAEQQRRIDRRIQKLERPWVEDTEDELSINAPEKLDLVRIVEIEAQATPVYLATFLYVPQEDKNEGLDWYACDFFGRHYSPELKRRVAEVAKSNPHLECELDKLLGRTVLDSSLADHRLRAEKREKAAKLELDDLLSLDVRKHPIYPALISLIDNWLELEELDAFGSKNKCENLLQSCRKVLEGVFGELKKDFPLTGIWRDGSRTTRKGTPAWRIPLDDQLREEMYVSAAKQLGVVNVPDSFLNVKGGQIKAVSDFENSWQLRPLLMATVLGAEREPNHPLRRAAVTLPDILNRADDLANQAGAAAHHAGETQLNRQSLQRAINNTLKIVGSLLELPVKELTEQGDHDDGKRKK